MSAPTGISRLTAQAMIYRGRVRMVQAVLGEAELTHPQRMFDYWRGFAQCAAALLSGAAEIMASHDQACDADRVTQAALACLPDHCEGLSFADMKHLMHAQRVDLGLQSVTHSDLHAVVQFQDGMGTPIELDNKHSVAAVDVRDGARLHADPSPVVNTVILCAPQGWGKTRKSESLMKEFGCTKLVDNWLKGKPITPGALHLTHQHGSVVAGIPPDVRLVTRGWPRVGKGGAA